MAYAEVPDLRARVGRLASAWVDGSAIAEPELDRFLDDAAALIDAVIGQYTTSVPATGTAALALRSLNAKMAALDALQSTFPSASGPNEARELIDSLRSQLFGSNGSGGEWGSLMDGKHPAVIVLKESGQVPQASSFWTNEPDYGQILEPFDLAHINPQLLPYWSRLSKL